MTIDRVKDMPPDILTVLDDLCGPWGIKPNTHLAQTLKGAKEEIERLRVAFNGMCGTAKNVLAQLATVNDEVKRLTEELDTWKSVFPDLAPENVQPDRALVEAENATLRAEVERLTDFVAFVARWAVYKTGKPDPTDPKDALGVIANHPVVRAALAEEKQG